MRQKRTIRLSRYNGESRILVDRPAFLTCSFPMKMSISVNGSGSMKLLPQYREAMQRLLDSQTFATSPRLRDVLNYLLRMLKEENLDEITEQSIGQVVFGRPPGYNASEDNIVRVTVRHLRSRLAEYYQSEGASEPIVLVIPKGKYIPVFQTRDVDSSIAAGEVHLPAQASDLLTGDKAQELAISPVSVRGRTRSSLQWIASLVALTIVFAAGYVCRSALRSSGHPSGIVTQVFPPGDDVTLVTVDTNLQAYRQIFKRQVNLQDYIRRSYTKGSVALSDARTADAYQFSIGTNETNVSSAIIASSMGQALEGRRFIIKHPHDVSIRDFQSQDNVILLGGPWSDPWGQLFENRFNFRVLPGTDSPFGSEIHNLHPVSGEQTEYRPHIDGNLNVNYVRIGILPNLDNTGHVVLLSATSPESLEAASEYLLSTAASRDLCAKFHVDSANVLPPVEVLLEAKGLNAAPGNYRILAVRAVK
jgi:hypothetical protein